MGAMTSQQLGEAPAEPQPRTDRPAGALSRPTVDRGRSEPLLERGFLVFVGVSLALIAAWLPFARMLDAHIDRRRPMYTDVRAMAWLQHLNLSAGGVVVQLRLSPGSSASVGNATFAPSPGVTIQVRRDRDGYCVAGSNQYGDATGWQCYDADNPPPKP